MILEGSAIVVYGILAVLVGFIFGVLANTIATRKKSVKNFKVKSE